MGAIICCPQVLSPSDLTSGGTWVAAAHTPACGLQAAHGHPPSTALPLEKTLGWSPWFASLPNTAHVALCPTTRWYKGHKHLQQKGTRAKQPGQQARQLQDRPVGCWWQKGRRDGPELRIPAPALLVWIWEPEVPEPHQVQRHGRRRGQPPWAALPPETTECPTPQGQITGWFPTFDTTLERSFIGHSSDLIKTVTGSPGRTRQGGPWHSEHPLGAWH